MELSGLNLVDLIILALVVGSSIHGLMQGAAVQLFSYLGFGIGLFVGAQLGPVLAGFVENPAGRIVVVTLTLFGTASLLGTIGRYLGAKTTWGVLQLPPLKAVNAAGGLGVAVIATLLTVWLVGGLLAQVRLGQLSIAFQDSKILRALTETLPPAPSVFSQIQRTFLPSGFPPVFAELEPSPAPPVPVAGGPEVQAAVAAAGNSVYKIQSPGCGLRLTTGSGFLADPNLVVTNAHVVAGVDRPEVQDRTGRTHRSTVVFFDPQMDLAVLRTSDLSGTPLAFSQATATRGQQGTVLGYPGGGPFTAQPGAVRRTFEDALGRDIYSRALVNRDVYQLEVQVRAGNSGGPFVESSGQVIGVVFASSLVTPDVAYALTSIEVASKVAQARATTSPVDTGPCTA